MDDDFFNKLIYHGRSQFRIIRVPFHQFDEHIAVPSFILLAICSGRSELDEMPEAPRYDPSAALELTVLTFPCVQYSGVSVRLTWFFADHQFQHFIYLLMLV